MKMGNTILTILGIIAGAVVVCVLGALGVGSGKQKSLPITIKSIRKKFKIKTINVTMLKFNDILAYFKTSKILEALANNKSLLAIVLKENNDDKTFSIIACLFDKEKNEVYNLENFGCIYEAKSIDSELNKAFGDRDQLVLK